MTMSIYDQLREADAVVARYARANETLRASLDHERRARRRLEMALHKHVVGKCDCEGGPVVCMHNVYALIPQKRREEMRT